MPITYVPLVSLAVFTVLFLLERVDPLRETKQGLLGHLAINTFVTALAFAANAASVQPTASFLLQWTGQERFGLMNRRRTLVFSNMS